MKNLSYSTYAVVILLLVVCLPNAAEAQYWSCMVVCPITNFKVVSPIGFGCRDNTDCALAFAGVESDYYARCGVSTPYEWSHSVQYIAVPFTDVSTCNSYFDVVNSAQAQIQADPTSAASKQTSDDASCTCNSVVTSLLEAFTLDNIPSSGTATALCSFAVDKAVSKLKESAMDICKKAGGLAAKICDLVFDVISGVLEPVTDAVVNICATILQTLLDALHLASTLQNLIAQIRSTGSSLITSLSNDFCGTSVCTNTQQSSCSRSGNSFAAIIESSNTLCNILKDAASGKTCFPGNAMITSCNGTQIAMQDLQSTELVMTASGTCSNAFYFSSKSKETFNWYLIVEAAQESAVTSPMIGDTTSATISNTSSSILRLRVHPQNYLLDATGNMFPAYKVQLGQQLQTPTGNATVRKAQWSRELGTYHPHVLSLDDYIVDGVIVSQFTTAVDPSIAIIGLRALRAAYNVGFAVDVDVIRTSTRRLLPVISFMGLDHINADTSMHTSSINGGFSNNQNQTVSYSTSQLLVTSANLSSTFPLGFSDRSIIFHGCSV